MGGGRLDIGTTEISSDYFIGEEEKKGGEGKIGNWFSACFLLHEGQTKLN